MTWKWLNLKLLPRNQSQLAMHSKKQGLAVHTHDLSTWKMEAGGQRVRDHLPKQTEEARQITTPHTKLMYATIIEETYHYRFGFFHLY